MRHAWLFGLALLLLLPPAHAALPADSYGPVVLSARVTNGRGQPVTGLPVRLSASLNGVAVDQWGQTRLLLSDFQAVAVTHADGLASVTMPPPFGAPPGWFQGQLRVEASLPADPHRELSPLAPLPARALRNVPALPGAFPDETGPLLLQVYEEAHTSVDGFPVWPDAQGRMDKIAVVLEGFDLYNTISATDVMALLGPAADALRARGVAILVVNYPDCHVSPEALAPLTARAIQAAARASGRKVVVVGLSEGGIVARWTLTTAENNGTPLPVSTLVTLDSPHRGANFDPGLQAMTLRAGKAIDRAALLSPAAAALMRERPTHVVWKRVGLPGADQAVPVRWDNDTSAFQAFYDRLHRLNAHNGYPTQCRLVGVATGSRVGGNPIGALLRLWLPWNFQWALPATPEDQAPGSLLPLLYVDRFNTLYPLGVAGAYLRAAPTFIPTSSALDAGPGETPPFDAWFARPDDAPPLPHDHASPDEAAFVVRQVLQSWP